jgi:hypothetical protein
MSSLALSYQDDPGLEKQIAHAEAKDLVVGDVTIAENANFPEGGTQAWMVVIGVWVILKFMMNIMTHLPILTVSLSSSPPLGICFPTCALFLS